MATWLRLFGSAGVGRTGTFIALDYLLDQANCEGKIDPFSLINQMRTRRPCMVQTEVKLFCSLPSVDMELEIIDRLCL